MKNRKKVIWTLILIMAVGVFLRSFHFGDWLHFELDQARDAKIALKAAEDGIGYLPLQGPRAAGSFLRLGPAFYYMQYLTAKVFGATPPAMAAGVLILSILTMPLFYLFARRYFNTRISAGLLAIFSTSIFLVMYSRFAWNPNLIPFFMLLSAYSLLKIVDHQEGHKQRWLYALAFSVAIGTQLHFLVFLILPTIVGIFLLIKRPKFKIQAWLIALGIIVLIYTPMIINDVKTGGENIQEFLAAVTNKSDESDHNLLEKATRNFTEHALGHFLIISGREQAELPKIETRSKILAPLDIKCDYDCRKNLIPGLVAGVFYAGGIILLIFEFFRNKEAGHKKDFLILSLIWLIVSFGVMTPLSYDIAPRFFLVTAPLAFVWLGLIFEFLEKFYSRRVIFWVLVVVLVGLNLSAIQERFWQLGSALTQDVEIQPDRILKERARVTYQQQNVIVDYLEDFYRQNGYPIYLQSESYYARSFIYILNDRKIPQDMLAVNTVYAEGNHFLIYRTAANWEDRLAKYLVNYETVGKKEFGTLTVFQLKPKPDSITAQKQVIEPAKADCGESSNVQKRYTWNEIFRKGECFEQDDESQDDLLEE